MLAVGTSLALGQGRSEAPGLRGRCGVEVSPLGPLLQVWTADDWKRMKDKIAMVLLFIWIVVFFIIMPWIYVTG